MPCIIEIEGENHEIADRAITKLIGCAVQFVAHARRVAQGTGECDAAARAPVRGRSARPFLFANLLTAMLPPNDRLYREARLLAVVQEGI